MTWPATPDGQDHLLRSPFVDYVDEARDLVRWCTPTTTIAQHHPGDPYRSDISASWGRMGSLLDLSGVFGEVSDFLARSYGAAVSLPGVNGTTGCNQVMASAAALLGPRAEVLVNRGAHHSVYRALAAAGVDFHFIAQKFDASFEAFEPVRAADVAEAIRRHPHADVVWVSSPTYEGLPAELSGIVDTVRAQTDGAAVFVDEAWGAHFAFHPDLAPLSALAAGADVVAQSTHKTAGALQQAAVLHIGVGASPVVADVVRAAWRDKTTTSPSYQLIGSIDAAVHLMHRHGTEYIEAAAKSARALEALVTAANPGIRVLSCRTHARCDPLKVTFALHRYAPTGHAVARALEEEGIVGEKAGIHTLTMLATYGLAFDAVRRTAKALTRALGEPLREPHGSAASPFNGDLSRADLPPVDAVRLARTIGRRVPLSNAIGTVALEEAEAYPPGVPILLPGYRVTADAVRYLLDTRKAGGRILASDPALNSILVAGESTPVLSLATPRTPPRRRRDDLAALGTSSYESTERLAADG
jgi:arginine decarboxylase